MKNDFENTLAKVYVYNFIYKKRLSEKVKKAQPTRKYNYRSKK